MPLTFHLILLICTTCGSNQQKMMTEDIRISLWLSYMLPVGHESLYLLTYWTTSIMWHTCILKKIHIMSIKQQSNYHVVITGRVKGRLYTMLSPIFILFRELQQLELNKSIPLSHIPKDYSHAFSTKWVKTAGQVYDCPRVLRLPNTVRVMWS